MGWADTVYKNHPNIAVLSNGNYVVTWSSTGVGTDASNTGVGGQLYASNGQPIGTPFLINTTTAS
jgi:hypothetical protein